MAGDYNDFPSPEAVHGRLTLIGEIESAWTVHPDESAIAVNGSMDVLRVLAGRMPPGSDAESRFFSNIIVTLVNLDAGGQSLNQVRVQGYRTTRMDCDLRPTREALAALERQQAVFDNLTERMVARTEFTRQLSDTALKLLIDAPRQLGPAFAARMDGFVPEGAPPVPVAATKEQPRILTRRRRP